MYITTDTVYRIDPIAAFKLFLLIQKIFAQPNLKRQTSNDLSKPFVTEIQL